MRPGRGQWLEAGAWAASPGQAGPLWRLRRLGLGLEVTRHQRGPAIITSWPGTREPSVTTVRAWGLHRAMARRYPGSSYDSRYSRGYMNSSSYLAGDRRDGVSYR